MLYTNRLLSNFNFVVPGSWGNDANQYALGKVSVSNKHAKVTVEEIEDDIIPNLTGMGLRDALFLLEKRHLKVKVQGVGKVTSQSIAAGSKIKPNETIMLTLGTKSAAKIPKTYEPATAAEQSGAPQDNGQQGH